MSENKQLIYNKAQTITWCAPEGQPDADGTVDIYDAGNTKIVDAATATSEGYSWSVDADSGKSQSNPRKLNLGSTANIETRKRYLLKEAGLPDMWVEAEEITANDHIICNIELPYDYSNSATLYSTWLSATVPQTAVDTENDLYGTSWQNWRAYWSYDVSGSSKTGFELYDLVRHDTYTSPLTENDVYERWETIRDYLRPSRIRLFQKLKFAWEAIKRAIRKDGYDPRLIRNLDAFDDVIYERLLLTLADHNVIPDAWRGRIEEYKASKRADFIAAMGLAMANVTWYDINNDDEVGSDEVDYKPIRTMVRY